MSVKKSKGEEKPKFARVVIFEKKPKAESTNILQDGGKITVRTAEEQKYVNMLLEVFRGNEQEKQNLIEDISCSHQRYLARRPCAPVKRNVLGALDSDEINTIEYGFYYVNGVLATTQRISHENGEGDTEQVPADFYWIVDEARERLDKIRTLLGFIIETDDSKENTLLSKQRAVNVLVEYLGDYRLDRLNEVVVERFIIQRQEGGTKPGTINEDVSKLKNVLNTACRAGILNSNTCKGVKKLRVEQSRDRVLTDSEIAVVLKGECLRAKDRLMILVSLFTGMRLNEVVSLRWSDIDFTKSLISVIQCKTGKALAIPISTYFVSELQAYKTNSPGDGVFEDKPLTQNLINGYSRYFVKLFKRLGFRGFTFHNLRHSFASLCGDLGTGAVITKELLGHSDLSMTLRYSHIGFDTKRNAIESLTNHVLAMNQEKVIAKITAQA